MPNRWLSLLPSTALALTAQQAARPKEAPRPLASVKAEAAAKPAPATPPTKPSGAARGVDALSARPRITERPDEAYWRTQGIASLLRTQGRRGAVPVVPFSPEAASLTHFAVPQEGWRAYGFLVPPGGTLEVDLKHAKPGWFRLTWCGKWAEARPGTKVDPGAPSGSFHNLESTVQAVYLVIDDPGRWSSQADPYTLEVRRSWDPKAFNPGDATLAVGLWNPLRGEGVAL